ncbi:MAG: hypothetical protein ACFB10_22665 [Salibacteraceae bacterium]
MRWLVAVLMCFPIGLLAQEGKWGQFKQLSWPEKRWVCWHPMAAAKAQKISQEARFRSDSLLNSPVLDGDGQGGRVDAYRHAWWMARLAQEIGPRKAISLGKAHEKANHRASRKGQSDGWHDRAAMEMDLKNNQAGAALVAKGEAITHQELHQRILEAIQSGELWILAKDAQGNYLDCAGKPIPQSAWQGQWITARCLQASN